MRADIHPDYKDVVFVDTSCDFKFLTRSTMDPTYREVCFQDLSNGFKFVTRSCAQTRETIKMEDGRELPLYKVETTSESHPFYTGKHKIMDTAGRVEKFRQRYARKPASEKPAAK